MKSNALRLLGATGKKVLTESGSEDIKGAWEGEGSPESPAKASGHPRKPPPLSWGAGQAAGGKHTRRLGWMQPWFPAVPGSLPLSRLQSLLTSLKPPSRAGSRRGAAGTIVTDVCER